jgi:hypothetical protein
VSAGRRGSPPHGHLVADVAGRRFVLAERHDLRAVVVIGKECAAVDPVE